MHVLLCRGFGNLRIKINHLGSSETFPFFNSKERKTCGLEPDVSCCKYYITLNKNGDRKAISVLRTAMSNLVTPRGASEISLVCSPGQGQGSAPSALHRPPRGVSPSPWALVERAPLLPRSHLLLAVVRVEGTMAAPVLAWQGQLGPSSLLQPGLVLGSCQVSVPGGFVRSKGPVALLRCTTLCMLIPASLRPEGSRRRWGLPSPRHRPRASVLWGNPGTQRCW